MSKYFPVLGLCISLSTLLLPGCVSKGDYDTLGKKIASMENELAVAKKELSSRQQDKALQTERCTILEQQNIQLRNSNQLLSDKNATLAHDLDAAKKSVLEVKKQAVQEQQALQYASDTYEDLVRSLKKEVKEGQVAVKEMKNRVQVTLVDRILFPAGTVAINAAGREILDKVAKVLIRVNDRRIQVEGHSDSSPVASDKKDLFPTNWEVSARRATEVVRYLIDQGVPGDRLAAVGLAHFHPVADNKTADGRRANRRIEIMLLPLPKTVAGELIP